jgi:hypothetical protein
MGHWTECDICKKEDRYDSGEIENVGTSWHPIWAVKCHNCGNQISWEKHKLDFIDKAQVSGTKNGIDIKSASSRKSGHERAQNSDVREYWIQEYIKENFIKLGLSKIEGPFDIGPDFKGVHKGKKSIIEAERDFQSFIEHGHHEDERFNEVNILIVLNPSQPPKEIKSKLPKTIIYIDIDDFIEWWHPKARAYAKTKKIQGIINLIAGEFQKRFVSECCDTDRDMSTCPECDLCPYFGEGTAYEASSIFQNMALKFIALYKYPITSEDFKVNDIKPSEINKFCFDFEEEEQTVDDSNRCPHCKPNVEEGRYFLPDGSSLPFYIDEKEIIHNPDCIKLKQGK